ncbi:MAG: hypothetical protein HYY93_06985 [Planctomycetes bacterium]|nr:hypothetical protein [Planctomycetota bacterium]
METRKEPENKSFDRIRTDHAVRFKFLTKEFTDPRLAEIREGTAVALAKDGLLLWAPPPPPEWTSDMLRARVYLGINLVLPTLPNPLKALARVAWIESVDNDRQRCYYGLRFQEIDDEAKLALQSFLSQKTGIW